MGAWKPRTLDELVKYVTREMPRLMRRSTGALNRADVGVDLATDAAAAADAANSAAEAASAQAADAASAAANAAGVAGGKADVFIQSTEPAATFQRSTTLWIDTTGGANTPKRWVDGTGWVAVTDKKALDAADAAVAAGILAQNAKDTADQAVQTANAAQTAATGAVTAANGKNTIKFRTVAPTTSGADAGGADGDLWFVIPNVQTGIVTGQYTWMAATQSWVQQTLSSAVLASIDAGKITTGTLVGITITGVTITGATVTGGTVQTSATGKRVVLANNKITFYGTDGTTAWNAGAIEGVPNGAGGGMILIGPGENDPILQIGNQALPTDGSATMRALGTAWFDDIYAGGGTVTGRYFRAPATGDASLTSTGHAFQIGDAAGPQLIMDNNELMVRDGQGGVATLYIQADGGNIGLGNGSSTIVLNGVLSSALLPSRFAMGTVTLGAASAGGFFPDVNINFPANRFTSPPLVLAIASNSRIVCGISSSVTTTARAVLGANNPTSVAINAGNTVSWFAFQFSG